MPQPTIKERLTAIEEQIAQMQARMKSSDRDWRKTIGMFSGDSQMKQFFAAALKLREEDRQKAHRAAKTAKPKR